jgi:hypothetical protein
MANRRPRPYSRYIQSLWILSSIALLVYFGLGSAHQLPVFVLTALIFPLAFVLFPAAAPDPVHTVSPHNLVLIFFFLSLILQPLSLALFDPQPIVREVIGYTDAALTGVLLIVTTAYVSYTAGYSFLKKRPQLRIPEASNVALSSGQKRTIEILPLFCTLGVLGFVFNYGSLSSYLEYYANPAMNLSRTAGLTGTSLFDVTATFLRAFPAFAVIGVWCLIIDRRCARMKPIAAAVVSVLFAGLVILASASFNRGAMIYPIMTMLAVFSARVHRVSFPTFIAIIFALLVPALIWGTYRSQRTTADEAFTSDGLARLVDDTSFAGSFADLPVQAHALEIFQTTGKFYWGATLPASVVYSIPILGRPYRQDSGYAIYNTLVHGAEGYYSDQVIPTYFEFFINFDIPGVIAGFFCFGLVMLRMQNAFLGARDAAALKQAAIFIVAFWTATLVFYPIAVLCSMIVFNFGPCYVCLWWFRRRRVQRKPPLVCTPRRTESATA